MSSVNKKNLIERRNETLGQYSPLFYENPRHFISSGGVWLTDADGNRHLDAYNNVPHVGHANPKVADAVASALHTYNVHTRYLSEPIVNYAEQLLDTFDSSLDRVYFTNSGSESNELALRIARHRSGNRGIIVTDYSYHGNTMTLAELTTGLMVSESRGDHVRTIKVPDLSETRDETEAEVLSRSLEELDAAISSLDAAGYGVSALLIEPLFSTEGMPTLPSGYLSAIADKIKSAGGLVISDEIQAGLGRLGGEWWAHQALGFDPDLVTLGKPMGNGFPLGGVVTSSEVLNDFSSENEYFNTFAGTAAAAAAGSAVLSEVREHSLIEHAHELGEHVRERLISMVSKYSRVSSARGRGLFFGLALQDEDGQPDSDLAVRVVERLAGQNILISKIGPHDNILKIRPPMVISQEQIDTLLDALDQALAFEHRDETV